jgi:hypothetical protein
VLLHCFRMHGYSADMLCCACCCVSQVVTILVKGDTVDVNVAGIQRMSPQAWAAAAGIFRSQLAGVQFLQQQQVRQQRPLQQLHAGGRSSAHLLC